MSPVAWFDFPFEDFDRMQSEGVHIPRGCLLSVSMNPFNGKVFVSAQNSEIAKDALKSIVSQIDSVINPKPSVRVIKGQRRLPIFEEVA